MSNFKTIELIDDIRNDALILMKENPNLKYQEAFKLAKEELIGKSSIYDFKFKPFTIEYDDSLNKKADSKKDEEGDYFLDVKNRLSKYINVEDYSTEQLKEYNIALQMGVDITKIADNKFSPKQLKVLCLLLASGKSIEDYRYNYDFNPSDVMVEMVNKEKKN